MLTHGDDVEPDRLGQLGLLHQLAQPLPRARRTRGGIRVDERGDPEFHGQLSVPRSAYFE